MGVSGDQRLSRGYTRESPTVIVRCRNCDAEMTGEYCSRCGQRDVPPNPTFRELAEEAWGSFVDVDGRFMQTMKLLVFRPGELTLRYLAGKRVSFILPLRLYLMCSFLYFFALAMSPGSTRGTLKVTGVNQELVKDPLNANDSIAGVTGPEYSRRVQRGMRRAAAEKGEFTTRLLSDAPKAVFVMVPVYALLLAAVYYKRKRRLPAHMIFALHAHAFTFLAFAVDLAGKQLLPKALEAALDAVVIASLLAWFTFALKRAYGGRWWPTIARSFVLGISYTICIGVLLTSMFIVEFYLMGAPIKA